MSDPAVLLSSLRPRLLHLAAVFGRGETGADPVERHQHECGSITLSRRDETRRHVQASGLAGWRGWGSVDGQFNGRFGCGYGEQGEVGAGGDE